MMSASEPTDRQPGPQRPRGSAAPGAQAARVLLLRDFDLGTLVAIRHEVERLCGLWGLTGLGLYRFVVAVNEITTNAVRHGGGSGRLRLWHVGRRLYCRIDDRGPGGAADPGRLPDPGSPEGRGLWLARQNVARLTLRSDPAGTTIELEAS
ncbi:ATP-binding protein [[Actinomadura] parvosata]|nr:ATP-binding protein [Nonomuraea sp. ATCC 55076]